jgi:NAD(P)-dependent dehydrogenase (short-subunit alcohol dehydrogenase family)
MITTRVTSPFGFESTAAEVIAGIDLHDRRALVTGAASGIGVETARALASAGAETVLAARDLAGPLHILVNNAGVMAVPELRRSPEGHELQFATNHLGHFRLALGLLPALRATGGSRVVSVSSRAHLNSPVIFDDIDFRDRPYDPALAYAQSKTANVLFAVAAARHWGGDGIEVNALHPGAIADSNLSRYYNPAELDALRSSGRYTFKTLAQGAATSVYVATSPRLNGVVGRYFENCQEDTPDDPAAAGTDAAGVAAYALDPEAAERLWAVSEQMNQ